MDFLPRLGVTLLFFLPGMAFIYWATSIRAFSGILGIVESFFTRGDTLTAAQSS